MPRTVLVSLCLLGGTAGAQSVAPAGPHPLRPYLDAILQAAAATPGNAGDRCFRACVRAALERADGTKDTALGRRSALLALGFFMDSGGFLARVPLLGRRFRGLETLQQKKRRQALARKASLRRRNDLARHFSVSAALRVLVGERAASLAGLQKELADARGRGSGLSFKDLCANEAGIRFASWVLAGGRVLDGGKDLRVRRFLPSLDGLEEGLGHRELVRRYGGAGDPRFKAAVERIRRRVAQHLPLPPRGGKGPPARRPGGGSAGPPGRGW